MKSKILTKRQLKLMKKYSKIIIKLSKEFDYPDLLRLLDSTARHLYPICDRDINLPYLILRERNFKYKVKVDVEKD